MIIRSTFPILLALLLIGLPHTRIYGQTTTTQDSPLIKIAKISDEKDLSDDQVFSRSLELKMESGPVEKGRFLFERCGFASPPEKATTIRQFAFRDTPWFLNSKMNGRLPCNSNYIERLKDGIHVDTVSVKLIIDLNQVCITQSEIVKYFPDAIQSPRAPSSGFIFHYKGKKGIDTWFISSLNRNFSSCLETILLGQTFPKSSK